MDFKFLGFIVCCIGVAGCTAKGDITGAAIALAAAAAMAWVIKDAERRP